MMKKLLAICVLLAALAAAANAQQQHHNPASRAVRAVGHFFETALGGPQWQPTTGQKAQHWAMMGAVVASVAAGGLRCNQSGRTSGQCGTMIGAGIMGGLTANHAYNTGNPGMAMVVGSVVAGANAAGAYGFGGYVPRATIFGPVSVVTGPPIKP